MNVACDYEAPMQMLTTEKYIAPRAGHRPIRKYISFWFGNIDTFPLHRMIINLMPLAVS